MNERIIYLVSVLKIQKMKYLAFACVFLITIRFSESEIDEKSLSVSAQVHVFLLKLIGNHEVVDETSQITATTEGPFIIGKRVLKFDENGNSYYKIEPISTDINPLLKHADKDEKLQQDYVKIYVPKELKLKYINILFLIQQQKKLRKQFIRESSENKSYQFILNKRRVYIKNKSV